MVTALSRTVVQAVVQEEVREATVLLAVLLAATITPTTAARGVGPAVAIPVSGMEAVEA